MNDSAFISAFHEGTLPVEMFDHRAHLRLAFVTLKNSPIPEAVDLVGKGIQGFARAAGEPGKYHATMTVAAVRLVASRMGDSFSRDFDGFLSAYPELVSDLASLIGAHYSEEVLSSDAARQRFVPPDIAPLPLGKPRKR